MKYCCETCGEVFGKEEEALGCENKHKLMLEYEETLKIERNKRFEEIKNKSSELIKLVKKYEEDYSTNIGFLHPYMCW